MQVSNFFYYYYFFVFVRQVSLPDMARFTLPRATVDDDDDDDDDDVVFDDDNELLDDININAAALAVRNKIDKSNASSSSFRCGIRIYIDFVCF